MEQAKLLGEGFDIIEVEKSSVVGYSTQRRWSSLIAMSFFLGELGAGIFFVSAIYNYYIGALIGFVVATVGKGIPHLLHLGRPERSLRSFLKPKSSWISRGLISLAVFSLFGILYLLPFLLKLAGSNLTILQGSPTWFSFKIIALLASLTVITYAGYLMSATRAIPFWNTPLMPILSLSYSFLGGATFVFSLSQHRIGDFSVLNIEFIQTTVMFLAVLNFILILTYIYAMYHSTIAARRSASLLIRGRYGFQFIGLVMIVGLVLMFGLLLYYGESRLIYLIPAAVVAQLIGYFTLKFILLRAGVFYPEIY